MIDQQKNSSIEERMKKDWDSRVSHDYRYWMSDGVASDTEMWETGERDLKLLLEGLSPELVKNSIMLELGCGVGRIIRAAANRAKEVIGIDVSEAAITRAQELIKAQNATFLVGNGKDLQPLHNSSIDLAISFAALGSISSRITAEYLRDLSRVVREGGLIRLQVYLGKEQDIPEEDTLALRSYDCDRFIRALEKAGFKANFLREVKLSFEVSDFEKGVVAFIIGAERTGDLSLSSTEILAELKETPEVASAEGWKGSLSGHLVALARAKQHLELGNVQDAKLAYQAAKFEYQGESEEAKLILDEIIKRESKTCVSCSGTCQNTKFSLVETEEGRAYSYEGVILSHQSAPRKAANAWAKRTLESLAPGTSSILFVGLGDGHYVKALADLFEGKLVICETNKDILELNADLTKDLQIITDLKYLEQNFSAELCVVQIPALPFYNPNLAEKIRYLKSVKKYQETLSPRVGIIGPFSGGTLPIAAYIQRALRSLDKVGHYIDLSQYSDMFKSFGSVLQKKSRQAGMENSFLELISNLVLNIVEERNLDIVISVAQAPLSPTVLEKLREKGVVTVHWFMEDTRRFTSWKEIAKHYDYFYLIQKDESIEDVLKTGASRVRYLPLACDPDIHIPHRLSAQEKCEYGSLVSFVGAGYNNRRHVFSKFGDLDFKIWGTEWPDASPFNRLVQRNGERISVADYVKIFSASTINLNLHSSQERDGVDPSGDFVNPRVFELASAGAFQITDKRSLLPELFEEGKEVITFSDEREIRELIKYYADKEDERRAVQLAAQKRVLSEHTYAHRLNEILNQVYADYGDHLRQRMDSSPWNRTLKLSEKFPELKVYLEEAKANKGEPNLETLVKPFLDKSTVLNETELKLLFMHHMRSQITQIQTLRNE